MKTSSVILVASALLLPSLPLAAAPALRVFIRASEKTHGPGEHDYPRFLEDWKKLLKQRGAVVDGALAFPTPKQLAKADVLIIYAADGASMAEPERAHLEAFLKRGGGLVVLHDGICGTNADWFKTMAGGAKQHGVMNWQTGPVELRFGDGRHAITQGVNDFELADELFYRLHLAPNVQVIASAARTNNEVVPQMWVYEKDKHRAFVSLQGHRYASFSLPHYRGLILRGIAWAGRRKVDLLTTAEERAGFRDPRGRPPAPDQSLQGIRLPEDFRLSLVAAEPLVTKPVALDWDARGQLWVALGPNAPVPPDHKAPLDRLVILEDANRDGRMDRRRVFYQEADAVTSFVFYRDGVIAAQPRQILWLRDCDADGVADRREGLYDGLEAEVRGLRWGLDGWIYGAVAGNRGAGTKVIGGSGKTFSQVGNGVIRFKPDGNALEIVAPSAGRASGLDFSWDGELFFTQTSGPHVSHVVMPERFFVRGRLGTNTAARAIEEHQKAFPLFTDLPAASGPGPIASSFSSASGAAIYDGAAWPAKFHGSFFVCAPAGHLVHEDIIVATESGMTFEAIRRDEEEFIAGTDQWFRPVDARVGPDGALYLLDVCQPPAGDRAVSGAAMNRAGAGDSARRDASRGRVWRIQCRNSRRVDIPVLDRAAPAELVKALEHPSGWVRRTAQRLLMEKPDQRAVLPLAALLTNRLHYARVHALWTLHHVGALDSPREMSLAQGGGGLSNPVISRGEPREISLTQGGGGLGNPVISRGEPREMSLAQGGGGLGNPVISRGEPREMSLAGGLGPSGDLFISQGEARLVYGITNSHPAVQRTALRVVEAAGLPITTNLEKAIVRQFKDTDDRTRLCALLALGHAPLSSNGVQSVLKLFPDLKDGWSRSAALGLAQVAPMDYLRAVFAAEKSENYRDLVAPLVEGICRNRQTNEAAEIVRLAAVHPTGTEKLNVAALQTVTKYLSPDFAPAWSDELEAAVEKLFTSKRRAVLLANLLLADYWSDKKALATQITETGKDLVAELENSELKDDERNQLLSGLAPVKSLRPQLIMTMADLLGTNTPAAVQKRIITELGRMNEQAAGDALIRALPRLSGDLRAQAFGTLLRRADDPAP